MANQQKRIKALIDKNIRDILQFELKNEVGFLTVTSVDVSDDYSFVRIYVSFFTNPNENFKKLSRAKGFVKSSLAKKISLRRSPEIQFILDDGFFKEQRIEKILKKEEEELKEIKKDEK